MCIMSYVIADLENKKRKKEWNEEEVRDYRDILRPNYPLEREGFDGNRRPERT